MRGGLLSVGVDVGEPPGSADPAPDEEGRRSGEPHAHRGEMERITLDLADTAIHGLFSASLELHAVLALVSDPEAERRVAGAIAHLDRTIQQVRLTAIGLLDSSRD